MNIDPTDIRSPHLELDDLIAAANGQPFGEAAGEHLAGCEQCRLEAGRWRLVAGGVRSLAADEPELGPARAADPTTPDTAVPVTATDLADVPAPAVLAGQPHRGGRRSRSGSARRARWAAGSAAAAFLLLVGVGEATGLVHVQVGGAATGTSTSTSTTVFTAVTGCTQLEQADGILEQVNGNNLIVQTVGGQTVTVATTAKTFISESGFTGTSGSLSSEITDGALVEVRSATSGGAIDAVIVTVGQPFSAVNPAGFASVEGTVADAGASGFTLVTSSGNRIPVTTSASTLVIVPHAHPDQLPVGTAIFAIGSAGPNGTLSARAAAAVTQSSSGSAHLSVHTSVKDCSPASIDRAILLAAGA